ncbi:MAG: LacI family transcriptional regulator [Propionibacteriaceae bacterium]|jgi:LacI family transcriptional regulator|nr:LacI family transcriptional regulator [Propionibacteriaceae bacterium]
MASGAAPASIFDVAREAGVSRATAARALGGYGSVSERSRAKVLAAAAKLDYSINAVARSMVTGRTMTLGALVADVANPFFARVIRGFSDGARANDYDVILVNTDESPAKEERGLRVLMENRVDGILLTPASLDKHEHLQAAVDRGQAVVQVDRYIPELETDVVVVDNYDAARRAVSRAIAAGHTRIATPEHGGADSKQEFCRITTMEDRFRGYLDAMANAGIEVPDRYRPKARHREGVRDAVLDLLRGPDRPTALFGLDDSFMLGIVDAANAENLAWPADIAIFGFDDTDWTTVLRPPLSVIAQPAYELGLCAAEALAARIADPSRPPAMTTLATSWTERSSLAPA